MAEATRKATAPKKATDKPAKADAATAKKPAAKKADPAPVKKTAAPRKTAGKKIVSDEQRYRMIAEAAYFRAESRHFKSDPVRDWIEAERDIALLLGEDD